MVERQARDLEVWAPVQVQMFLLKSDKVSDVLCYKPIPIIYDLAWIAARMEV